jgi:hypothetical protein
MDVNVIYISSMNYSLVCDDEVSEMSSTDVMLYS